MQNPTNKRYALGIEYAGHVYSGFQSQIGQKTIQSQLEKALSEIAAHPVEVFVAGRTDRGVHATEQVVHFDSYASRDISAWVKGTNVLLPKDIRVLWARPVPSDFHARHSAVARRYFYYILSSKIAPALGHEQVTWVHYPLDLKKMNEAAQYFVGTHDFSSFRASECQSKSTIRDLHHLEIRSIRKNSREELLVIDIKANAFLHHMVRNITGVLLQVGNHKLEPSAVRDIIEAKDRTKAAKTAPANGLYFVKVHYDKDYGFEDSPLGPRFLAE